MVYSHYIFWYTILILNSLWFFLKLNMEEQMIFGALQTLNEEAYEDAVFHQENAHKTPTPYTMSTGNAHKTPTPYTMSTGNAHNIPTPYSLHHVHR